MKMRKKATFAQMMVVIFTVWGNDMIGFADEINNIIEWNKHWDDMMRIDIETSIANAFCRELTYLFHKMDIDRRVGMERYGDDISIKLMKKANKFFIQAGYDPFGRVRIMQSYLNYKEEEV